MGPNSRINTDKKRILVKDGEEESSKSMKQIYLKVKKSSLETGRTEEEVSIGLTEPQERMEIIVETQQ